MWYGRLARRAFGFMGHFNKKRYFVGILVQRFGQLITLEHVEECIPLEAWCVGAYSGVQFSFMEDLKSGGR